MRSVKMNKNELLEIVRNNKHKHIEQYQESVEDYKAVCVKVAKDNLKIAKSWNGSDAYPFKSIPQIPVSYESSYSKAIRMLELSVEEEIELEATIFNQLVLDEWAWKDSFVTASATYKSFR